MPNGPEPVLTPVSFGFTADDVVVVTGAASGIGLATALQAASLGLRVAAWDLNIDGARSTAQRISAAGGECLPVAADVTQPHQVERAFDESAALGEARYVVNNAGPASASGPQLDFDAALVAAVGSVRLVTETWLARDRPADTALVNLSSVAGNRFGTPSQWYPAAKAAIMGYTRHLAAFRSAEVRANAVAPGMTDTPRMAGYGETEIGKRALDRVPLHRFGWPSEIAWAVLFLLSPLAAYINGALLIVDGGWTVAQ